MGLYDVDGFEYHEGIVKTPLDCHDCGKDFIARINYDKDGNHKIICPICGHVHWRVIKKGVVTGDRWGSSHNNVEVPTERMWNAPQEGLQTLSAARYIREKFNK